MRGVPNKTGHLNAFVGKKMAQDVREYCDANGLMLQDFARKVYTAYLKAHPLDTRMVTLRVPAHMAAKLKAMNGVAHTISNPWRDSPKYQAYVARRKKQGWFHKHDAKRDQTVAA